MDRLLSNIEVCAAHNHQIKEMRYAHSLLKALCVSKRRLLDENGYPNTDNIINNTNGLKVM